MSIEIYGGHDPEELKKNWRAYHPPMIPIYYMELEQMKKMFELNERAVHPIGLQVMMGFFEEHEKYEHAALVRDIMYRIGLFTEEVKEHDSLLDQASDGEVFVDEILGKVDFSSLPEDDDDDEDEEDEDDDLDIFNPKNNPFL